MRGNVTQETAHSTEAPDDVTQNALVVRYQEQLRESQSRFKLPAWINPALTMFLLLLLWEGFVRILELPKFLLPSPSDVTVVLWEDALKLGPHYYTTALEAVSGLLLAIVVGVLVAVLLVAVPLLERSFYPLLVAVQSIPKIAIAPLLVIWFGFGLQPKILVAFLLAFFPIVISAIAGLKSASTEHIDLVRSMGASELQIFRRIRLHGALPYFFSGAKIGATLAVIGALVGEFMGSDIGLGYQLLYASGRVDTVTVFAAVVLLATIGMALFYTVVVVEKLAIPWHVSQRKSG